MARRRKEENRDLEPGVYRHKSGGYRVKGHDRKDKYFGKKRYADAVALAREVSSRIVEPDAIEVLVEQFVELLPTITKNRPVTIYKKTGLLRRYANNLKGKSVLKITHVSLQSIFNTMPDAQYQSHRKVWKQFGDWLVSEGFWPENFVIKTMPRQHVRAKHRHTEEGYQTIYEHAEEWLRVAMELAVSSLQDRTVLCELEESDIDGDRMRLTRHKTGANLAIKIVEGSRLERAVEASRAQFTAGSTLIRRIPKRRRAGPDWSRVNPNYLTHAFTAARDESEAYAHLQPELRPDFRALRSFGAHLYREAGHTEQYVQALLAHRSVDLTNYYADDGYQPRYVDVEAGLVNTEPK